MSLKPVLKLVAIPEHSKVVRPETLNRLNRLDEQNHKLEKWRNSPRQKALKAVDKNMINRTYAIKDGNRVRQVRGPFVYTLLKKLAESIDPEKGYAAIDYKTLAKKAMMSDRYAKLILKHFIEKGLLYRKYNHSSFDGWNTKNYWSFKSIN